MQTFAFITLVVIFIATTHLLNYGIRKINENTGNDAGLFNFFLCIFYGIFNYFTLKYIIIWGYPLIV